MDQCVHYETFKVNEFMLNILAFAKLDYYIKRLQLKSKNCFCIVNKVLHKNQIVLPNIIYSYNNMVHYFNTLFCKNI